MVYGWSSPNTIASVAIVNSKYLTMNNFYVTWEVLENSMLPEVFLTWKLTTFWNFISFVFVTQNDYFYVRKSCTNVYIMIFF